MAREVGLPLMARRWPPSSAATWRRSPRSCTRCATVAHHFGGSHAQRDLIDQTLLAAAAAPGGDRALGRLLLNERRLAKPNTPLTQHWARRLGATAH